VTSSADRTPLPVRNTARRPGHRRASLGGIMFWYERNPASKAYWEAFQQERAEHNRRFFDTEAPTSGPNVWLFHNCLLEELAIRLRDVRSLVPNQNWGLEADRLIEDAVEASRRLVLRLRDTHETKTKVEVEVEADAGTTDKYTFVYVKSELDYNALHMDTFGVPSIALCSALKRSLNTTQFPKDPDGLEANTKTLSAVTAVCKAFSDNKVLEDVEVLKARGREALARRASGPLG
jgi:hypothetical protein